MSNYRKRKRGSNRQIGQTFKIRDHVIGYTEPQLRIYPVQHQWTIPHEYTTTFTYQNGFSETVTSVARDPKTAMVQAMASRKYKDDIPVNIESNNQLFTAALALGGLYLLTRLFGHKDPGTSSEVNQALDELKSENPRIQEAGRIRLQTLLEREKNIIPLREQQDLQRDLARRQLQVAQAQTVGQVLGGTTGQVAAGSLAGALGGPEAVAGISALRGIQQAPPPAAAPATIVQRPPPPPPSAPAVMIPQPEMQLAQPQAIPQQSSVPEQVGASSIYRIGGKDYELVNPTPYFRLKRQPGPPGTTVR